MEKLAGLWPACGHRFIEVAVAGRERECYWSGLEGWSWSGVRPSCSGLFIHATAPEVVVEGWMS